MIGNEILLACLIFALARLGITFMVIPRSATPSQRQAWAGAAQIDYLVKDTPQVSILGVSSYFIDPVIKYHCDSDDGNPPTINGVPELLMVLIGSGSTGRAKLIPITHKQMKVRAEVINEVYEYTPQDRTATMAHMEYAAAITRLFSIFELGSSFVFLDRANFDLQRLQADYALTRLSSTVFHVECMLAEAKGSSEPLLGDLQLSVTSSLVTENLRHRITNYLTKNLWIAYGTNEVWTTTIATPNDVLTHPRTVGKLAPGAQIQIVDDNFKALPPNTVGLICIKARGAVDHYLNLDADDETVFRDGWFIPRDVGMMTPDGHLIFYGRSDNLMIHNGINIYPTEIENCLANHPCVKDAIAIPFSHPIHHQIPVAIVSLLQRATAEELLRYCEELIGFRAPQRIFIVAELCRNKQGKIPRETVTKLIEEINQQQRSNF
jgi:acyl-coenzyme A synthetase/AMP-(fatty) acid ligase